VALPDGRVIVFDDSGWQAALARPRGPATYQLAQVPPRGIDMVFVLNRMADTGVESALGPLAGRIDLQRVGAFGHSLGGMAAARACALDRRIRACMNQDADYLGLPFLAGDGIGMTQPFLFFASDHSLYERPGAPRPSDEALAQEGMTRAGYDSLVHANHLTQERALGALHGGAWLVAIVTPGFRHRSFIDLDLLAATDLAGAVSAGRNLALIREYTRAFFDHTLKGKRRTALDGDRTPAGVTIKRY
jgi:hypothetical protein